MSNLEIENYIANSPEFARPIFIHLVQLILKACPEATTSIKWGFPHYSYKGKILCSFAAFSKYCAFSIPTAKMMQDQSLQKMAEAEIAMGHFGKITTIDDLPSDNKIIGYLKAAMSIIESKPTKQQKINKEKIVALLIPEALMKALHAEIEILKKFEKMPPSHQREYINYINDAKKIATKIKRVEKVIELLKTK